MNAIEELEVLQSAIELTISRMVKLEKAVNGKNPIQVKNRILGSRRKHQSEIQVLQNDLGGVKSLINQLVNGNENFQRLLKMEC